MQEYSVKVTLPDGQVMAVTASESDTLEAVADRFKDYYEDDIILGIVNGRLRELNKKIKSDCELSFVTTADRDGRRTYRRSVVLLLQRAIYDVYGSMTQLHVCIRSEKAIIVSLRKQWSVRTANRKNIMKIQTKAAEKTVRKA